MKVALLGIEGQFTVDTKFGIERYMTELYQNLKLLNNKDFHSEKVEISKAPLLGAGLSFSLKTFFLDLNEFDITHVLFPIPLSRPKALRRNILITTVHDFHPILYPESTFKNGVTLKDRLWLELICKPGFERSDYLITNSTQTREEAIKLGFDKDRVFTSNHGIDHRYFAPIKHKKAKREFTAGYLGGIGGQKNVGFAINAVNLIKNDDIEFQIWGKNDDSSLGGLVKNKNITFKGFAPENSVIKIYDSFDAFVFPSLYEGFGLPILEAQARGLPVIIYKKARITKEVRKYCLEASSPAHMAQIIMKLKENGYNEKQRKKATGYARSFTWERNARGTLEVYNKIMKT